MNKIYEQLGTIIRANLTVNNTVSVNWTKYCREYLLPQRNTDTRESRNPDHHQYSTTYSILITPDQ